MVLPQRITHSLVNLLKRFRPLWMSLHFTHPDEITPETAQACERLADAGIPLGSQTVLLKDVNDSVPVMKKLMHELLKIRVRPYYLYQCDPILGSSHFRTSVEKGLEIIEGLRGHTSGYAVPHYVIDAPNGGGKIPLLPDYYQGRDGWRRAAEKLPEQHIPLPRPGLRRRGAGRGLAVTATAPGQDCRLHIFFSWHKITMKSNRRGTHEHWLDL